MRKRGIKGDIRMDVKATEEERGEQKERRKINGEEEWRW